MSEETRRCADLEQLFTKYGHMSYWDICEENERLKGALQYVANGENTTVEKLISDWEAFTKI